MFILYIIIGVFALWLGILGAVYYFQESMIFHPEVLPFQHEFQFDRPFEERNFVLDKGIVINAIHFKEPQPKGLIFYLHGNAGSLQNWGEKAADFMDNGYDVLMWDYRSYGKSTGKIKRERMLHKDARRLYELMLKEYHEEQVIIYGASLGTGIATRLASENAPKKLLLETPYFNFYNVAKFHYPYLPNSVLLKYHLNTQKFIQKVKCPIYLFHGTSDQTVPYENSEKLEALSPNIKLITLENGLHNNLNTFNLYHTELREILD